MNNNGNANAQIQAVPLGSMGYMFTENGDLILQLKSSVVAVNYAINKLDYKSFIKLFGDISDKMKEKDSGILVPKLVIQ